MKNIPFLLACAAMIMTSSVASARPRDTPDVQLQKMLAGRTAGQPMNCIGLSSITSSQIVDGKAIVYRVGSTLYVNAPTSGAEQLDDDDILVTRTFGSQLCSIDTVRLIDRTSRFARGFVILGKFVPYPRPVRAS